MLPAHGILPRALRQALAATVALLCVATHGASVGHLLLTPHVVCPIHGELVDSGSAHAAALTVPSGPPAARRDAISPVHGGERAEHADEHCTLLASPRENAIIAASSASLIDLAADEALASPPATNPSLDGRVGYAVAPKQSPPV